MQTRTKGFYLLFINISFIIAVVFIVLPNLDISLINHNIEKNIDANVYLYTEIDIKEEWSRK